MPFSLKRLGAGLMAASGDPAGAAGIRDIDNREEQARQDELNFRRDSAATAAEIQRKVFASLYDKAIENGADDDVLQKLESGLGVQIPEGVAGGIGAKIRAKAELDSKRKDFHSVLRSGKFTPGSISKAVSSGFDISLLEPDSQAQKNTVLNPGGIMVDSQGNKLAENTNVRPTSPGRATDMQRRQAFVKRRAEENPIPQNSEKLSDRFALARRKIDESVASGITTPSTGDKLKISLDGRKDALVKYDNSAEKAVRILTDNPKAATVGGDVARSVQSMYANISGLWGTITNSDPSLELEETAWSEELKSLAGDDAELRSTLFNLALQQALAEGLISGRASNQQIEFALEQMAAKGRSPAAIKRRIHETRLRVAEALEISLNNALEDYSALDQPDPTAERPGDISEALWNAMTPEERKAVSNGPR